ncbi:sigma factor-like helix-turn-helix DNA-binding protein [Variovorax sp. OV329]|uniref:sigma factor-like helix-turn-helix DNA-binding protein n=1 Tax=Variovorax sp. OV329 TaxID=1882825 RepID=UPI0008E5CAE3|nr:sigma factor-like helix-turn-helix DNA-binding protein [Variovorax sp. OV329]SFL87294.1 Sigma-70, region 4 [Variovorax sp. OV329]
MAKAWAAKALKDAAHEDRVVAATDALTLEECAQRLGITKEGVRRVEARALRKAAIILAERGIGPEDLLDDDAGASSSVLATMGAMSRSMRR